MSFITPRRIQNGLLIVCILLQENVAICDTTRAIKLWKSLNGTNMAASDPEIIAIEKELDKGESLDAALYAINSSKSTFALDTIKKTFGPLASRELDYAAPPGDFILTLMLGTLKNIPISDLFLTEVRYAPVDLDSPMSESELVRKTVEIINQTFSDADLLREARFANIGQEGINENSALGVITSAQYARAIFEGGTNRRPIRKLAEDFLCIDNLQSIVSFQIQDSWVGRDVERFPGGDFSTYLNKCSGCHSGMDALRGAFANYDYSANALRVSRGPVAKMNNNPNNFPEGHLVSDMRWKHYGWLPIRKDLVGSSFQGAKSFIQLIVSSPEFYSCLSYRAAKAMCPTKTFNSTTMSEIASDTQTHQDIKRLFGKVATDVCLSE